MSEFEDYVRNERERLTAERNDLLDQRSGIDSLLAEIDREFAAVDAYEAAKTGKGQKIIAGLQDAVAHAKRARRGSIRETIANTVSAAPAGLSRGDLLDVLGLKGDKSAEMSLSNALTAMVKNGSLTREDGRYHVPATALYEAAE
jgi:hypothetical protein